MKYVVVIGDGMADNATTGFENVRNVFDSSDYSSVRSEAVLHSLLERYMLMVKDILIKNKTLLENVKGTPLETVVYLASRFGLRRGELIGLRWSSIDFERGILSITGTVKDKGKSGSKIFLRYRSNVFTEVSYRRDSRQKRYAMFTEYCTRLLTKQSKWSFSRKMSLICVICPRYGKLRCIPFPVSNSRNSCGEQKKIPSMSQSSVLPFSLACAKPKSSVLHGIVSISKRIPYESTGSTSGLITVPEKVTTTSHP